MGTYAATNSPPSAKHMEGKTKYEKRKIQAPVVIF